MTGEDVGTFGKHFETLPSQQDCVAKCQSWLKSYDWGDDGATTSADWELLGEDGGRVFAGTVQIEIEPNHLAMILYVGGNPDCAHVWRQEGTTPCSMDHGPVKGKHEKSSALCTKCGLRRIMHMADGKLIPGQWGAIQYEQQPLSDRGQPSAAHAYAGPHSMASRTTSYAGSHQKPKDP
jgi:hypothetical protein